MKKANGLGKHIDQAVAAMREAHKANPDMTKKELHDYAVAAAGGAMQITKAADRAIWAAVYRVSKKCQEVEDFEHELF